jgi:hypothetical protein
MREDTREPAELSDCNHTPDHSENSAFSSQHELPVPWPEHFCSGTVPPVARTLLFGLTACGLTASMYFSVFDG